MAKAVTEALAVSAALPRLRWELGRGGTAKIDAHEQSVDVSEKVLLIALRTAE